MNAIIKTQYNFKNPVKVPKGPFIYYVITILGFLDPSPPTSACF